MANHHFPFPKRESAKSFKQTNAHYNLLGGECFLKIARGRRRARGTLKLRERERARSAVGSFRTRTRGKNTAPQSDFVTVPAMLIKVEMSRETGYMYPESRCDL
ncbi:hypothetical protein EVAR_32599_1 [Eumeta japonica]|uniref:Uncharacterized protein n=1 Tax=Eumeta variegata TaxID=151549 RepID=A0A4C1WJQ1_EUMVA|nr:hypothetical protein EVAR_32599_1 [Eumeta japonica]